MAYGDRQSDKQYKKIKHTSFSMKRTKVNAPERIFLEMWQEECERKPGINGGRGILEILLTPEKYDNGYTSTRISQRDAKVAASVIQWLGTSCGMGFLIETEKKIQREEAKYHIDFYKERSRLEEEHRVAAEERKKKIEMDKIKQQKKELEESIRRSKLGHKFIDI